MAWKSATCKVHKIWIDGNEKGSVKWLNEIIHWQPAQKKWIICVQFSLRDKWNFFAFFSSDLLTGIHVIFELLHVIYIPNLHIMHHLCLESSACYMNYYELMVKIKHSFAWIIFNWCCGSIYMCCQARLSQPQRETHKFVAFEEWKGFMCMIPAG